MIDWFVAANRVVLAQITLAHVAAAVPIILAVGLACRLRKGSA